MKKIDLKCDSCGSSLTKGLMEEDVYVCSHCGNKQKYVEDKLFVENKNIINQTITKNIYGNEKEEYTELLQKAETYIKLCDYKTAINILNRAVEENPSNYMGWWLLVKSKLLFNIDVLKNAKTVIAKLKLKKYKDDYDKVLKLAEKNEISTISKQYEKLIGELNSFDESNMYDSLSIDANFEKQKNGFAGQIVAFAIFVCIGLAVLIVAITFCIKGDSSTLALFVMSALFIICGCVLLHTAFKDKKFISFISSKEKITVDEVMNFYTERVHQIIPIEERRLLIIKKVEKLINLGYLVGYKLVNSEYLIKVSNEIKTVKD